MEDSLSVSRSSRTIQLLLVMSVSFLLPVSTSLAVFLGWWQLPVASQSRLVFRLVYEFTGLLFLWLVLKHQHRNFKDIGFTLPMRLREIAHSFGILFAVLILGVAAGLFLLEVYSVSGQPFPRHFDAAAIFGSQVTLLAVVTTWVNPFFEELLVRAFLITEVEQLYRSTTLAVFISVALQASYHFYQGLAAALIHASTFLIFSIYFVRRRRILPVIMAHLYMDVMALALYARHLGRF